MKLESTSKFTIIALMSIGLALSIGIAIVDKGFYTDFFIPIGAAMLVSGVILVYNLVNK